MCLNKNSFDLLLISFLFYISNSLEKWAENSGVLLNWLCQEIIIWNKNSKVLLKKQQSTNSIQQKQCKLIGSVI